MDNYANALKSLDTILKSYDPRNLPRPQSGNGNVTVETNAFIRSIHEVDEHNMVQIFSVRRQKYEFDISLKVPWFYSISGIYIIHDTSSTMAGQTFSIR